MRRAARLLLLLALFACNREDTSYEAAREQLKQFAVAELPAGVEPLAVDFDGKLRLVGYKLEPKSGVLPGKRYSLTLYWRVEKPIDPSFRLATHLLDDSGTSIVSLDEAGPLRQLREGKPALPPAAWQRGKVYVDELSFRVPRTRTRTFQIVTEVSDRDQRLRVASGAHEADRALVTTIEVPKRARRAPRVPSADVQKLAPDTKITIDGKLEEPVWKTTPALGFVDVSTGEENTSFPVNGSVRLLWSDAGFYAGFEIRDPDVIGGFPIGAKDPHLWTKDAVEIMVDPDGDGDNLDYYEIQVNPQNLVFDSQFDRYNAPKTEPDGPFGHEEWSANLKSAVGIDGTLDASGDRDGGYVVELLVPWKAFGKAKQTPPAPGDTWRLNFYAMQQNSGVAWSPILGEGNFHKATRFGRVIWAERRVEAASR